MKSIILVCCHKDDPVKENELYKPIHVGKDLSSVQLPYITDDTGCNISKKNKNYCELTGLYWAWKNLKNIDYIGLCHYRRYFHLEKDCLFGKDIYIYPTTQFSSQLIEDLKPQQLLKKYDIVLAKRTIYPYSLKVNYSCEHLSIDYKILKSVIEDLSPDYIDAFLKIMENNNKLSPCNMFFTKWNIFDDYCTWLFPILEEVERRIDISVYDNVQSRIFGYMGERLLNVYVEKHHLNPKLLPIVWFSDDFENISYPHYILNMMRHNLTFSLMKSIRKH